MSKKEIIELFKKFNIDIDKKLKKDELLKLIKEKDLKLKLYISPLRYPGGKSKAIKILEKYFSLLNNESKTIISPFIGGGSFELFLSRENKIIANDLFYPLICFWKNLQENKEELIKKIKSELPISKEKFIKMRKEIETEENTLNISSYYYLINRSSFSGSTFCGGYSKESAEKRLTNSIIDNLYDICLDNFEFHNKDWCEFLSLFKKEKSIIFLDPPYYIKNYIYGKNGDLHMNFDHIKLRDYLKRKTNWILCYNDCEYIRNLYKDFKIFEEKWNYGMNSDKKSSEIIIINL